MKILQVQQGREFTLLEVADPRPGPGEVILRVEAVTTCPQWDLHLRHNEPMFPGHTFASPYTPGQPGHEATGTVTVVGEGVTELQVGDRVSAWRDPGHQRNGCYAQYVVHRAENLIKVPAHLPLAATAPVELAMCVGATFLRLREMNALHGKRIGIMGLGPAGLIAAQMARAEGALEVIGLELNPARRAEAASLGFDAAYDPREVTEEVLPRRSAISALDGFVDCVGAKASVEWAMDRARDFVALFGVQREPYIFETRHYTLMLVGYPGHSRAAADYAVGLMEAGTLDLSRLVTHHLPLTQYAEGVDLLEKQEAVKVCFYPWQAGA